MDNLEQYKSQINIKEIGIEGQKKLSNAKILIVGMGGLGTINAQYLTSSGIGLIGILDFDKIELSNLSRQPLYGLDDLKKNKVDIAAEVLKKLNKNIKIIKHNEKLTINNAEDIIKNYDLIIDCSDNFSTKFLINDICRMLKKPFVYGSLRQFQGYVATFLPYGPCYRCLQGKAPSEKIENCSEAGALPTTAGIIGLFQATEAIKYFLDISFEFNLFFIDTKNNSIKPIHIEKNNNCKYCDITKEQLNKNDYKIEICQPNIKIKEISPKELASQNNFLLLDVRTPEEVSIAKIPNSTNIPLDQLENNHNQLKKDQEIIIYCHHGSRSLAACQILKEKGFKTINLKGGIDQYSLEIDNSIQRY